MLVTIFLLICAAVLGTPLVYRAFSGRRTSRAATRNGSAAVSPAQCTAQHPGEVTIRDVEAALRGHGLSSADVRLVSIRARALGMKPFTMWMSIQAYGGREVAVAVAGDLPHEALLAHLADATAPNFSELELFAALNGLAAAMIAAPAPGSRGRPRLAPAAMERSQVIKRRALADLDIHEPGTWPHAV